MNMIHQYGHFLTDDSNYALSAIELIKSIEKNTNITKFDNTEDEDNTRNRKEKD